MGVRPCVPPRAVCQLSLGVAAGGSCPAIDRRPPPLTSAAPIGARRRPPRHWPRRAAQRRAPPLPPHTAATPRSPPLNLVLECVEGYIRRFPARVGCPNGTRLVPQNWIAHFAFIQIDEKIVRDFIPSEGPTGALLYNLILIMGLFEFC